MSSLRYLILWIWIGLLILIILLYIWWWTLHPIIEIKTMLNVGGKSLAIIVPQLTLAVSYFFEIGVFKTAEKDKAKEKLALSLILTYVFIFLAFAYFLLFYTKLSIGEVSDLIVQVMSLLSSILVIIPMTSLFKGKGNAVEQPKEP